MNKKVSVFYVIWAVFLWGSASVGWYCSQLRIDRLESQLRHMFEYFDDHAMAIHPSKAFMSNAAAAVESAVTNTRLIEVIIRHNRYDGEYATQLARELEGVFSGGGYPVVMEKTNRASIGVSVVLPTCFDNENMRSALLMMFEAIGQEPSITSVTNRQPLVITVGSKP